MESALAKVAQGPLSPSTVSLLSWRARFIGIVRRRVEGSRFVSASAPALYLASFILAHTPSSCFCFFIAASRALPSEGRA